MFLFSNRPSDWTELKPSSILITSCFSMVSNVSKFNQITLVRSVCDGVCMCVYVCVMFGDNDEYACKEQTDTHYWYNHCNYYVCVLVSLML